MQSLCQAKKISMTSNVLPLHFAPSQDSSSQNSNVDSYSEVLWSWFLETKLIWVIFTDIPVDHPITAPISAFAFSGNGFLIVLICIERFVMIIYPEKSKIWCSKRKTIIYICVASLTSLLMSVPDFFAYSWNENGKVQVNLCQKLLFLHQLTNNAIWQQIVHGITSSVHENCKHRTWAEHLLNW